ncbi:PadR family transcriptional regulator [Micromonospora sp. DT201]|uniref:PadR family transcriptional regulator n=1 Tax=Micromonospora sp. DT201 TaxID=3393442 RepID=UPI003CEE6688
MGVSELLTCSTYSCLSTHVNATRLFVLGALAKDGPMHGHRMRNALQLDQVELWTEIKPGSLYGALHRMADEGAIEVVGTEREGNLPARTVYAITDAGRAELTTRLRAALNDARLRPDPIDVALQHADLLDRAELTTLVTRRRAALSGRLAEMTALRGRAAEHLIGLEPVIFHHTLVRLETEVAWHDELLAALALHDTTANDTTAPDA